MTAAVELSDWPSTTETRGRRARYYPHGFARVARAAAQRAHDGRGWSPATFAADRRKNEGCERLWAVGLDFDRAGDPGRVAHALRDYAGLVHSTRRHTDAAPRCRAVLWLSRAVTPAEHEQLWAFVVGLLPAELADGLDRGTRDEARLWFLPSRDAEGRPGVVLELSGWALDVDGVLRRMPREEPQEEEPSPPKRAERRSAPRGDAAALDALELRVSRAPKGERNSTLNAAAFSAAGLVSAGRADEREARAALERGARACGLPDAEARATIASGWVAGSARPLESEERPAPRARAARARAEADATAEDEPNGERPTIRVGVDLLRVGDDACAALARDGSLYVRAHEIVTVVCAAESDPTRGVVAGAPLVRAVGVPTLRERLAAVAKWERWRAGKEKGGDGEWCPCAPPEAIVTAVHARAQWPGLRPLVGTCEAPTMRRDGSLLLTPGYDPATGLLFVPGVDVPSVPDRPTQADAQRALAELYEPLAEFPWSAESDRAAVVAALLTVVGRSAIDGPIPGLALDANAPASGKSITADIVATIATGRQAGRATYPEQNEELAKVLHSVALAGSPLLALDNVTRPIEGGALDLALTADRIEVRPLGRSEMLSLSWRALVMATGNGLDVRGDTRRRFLVARLEPQVESPEDRTGFRIPDLRAWCRAHRGRLVAAALTVLRAYVAAGRPDVGTKTWGSYEAWAALVPPSIVFAGGADPMLSRLRPEEDGHRAALATVLAAWRRIAPGGETVKGMIGHLYPLERLRGERCAPDGEDETRAALEVLAPPRAGAAPDARRVGEVLRTIRRRPIAGWRLESVTGHGGVSRWRVDAC
jgi:hypothetical protein